MRIEIESIKRKEKIYTNRFKRNNYKHSEILTKE